MTGHLLQVFGECCWPVLYEWQCLHRNNSLGGPYDMDMCGDCTPATPFCGEVHLLKLPPSYGSSSNSSSFSFFQNGPINKGERRSGPVQLKDVHRIWASLQQGPRNVERLLGPNRSPISTEVEAVQEDNALCPAGQKEISVGKKRRKFFSAVRRQREDSSVQRRAAKVEPPVKGNPVIIVN
ncbi:hypothetical protein TYRP_023543 [Tyrophagus putrescentiae]|nr:hypothetical protein TYRP_023543 [Tyrophagus putrescentiae]